jgi:glycosyltransferase involved in cell wall biosynthesis
LKSLEAAQVPYVLNNVKTPFHRENDPTFVEFSAINPYRVNLVHVNADQTYVFANDKGPGYFKGRYNIGYWFWELSTFPKQWRSAFEGYQEIWVASSFCQESIASQSPLPVVKMTFPILMDANEIEPNRTHFDLPEDQFTFGFVFDYLSLAERKNPYGLLQAFEMAFGNKKDALLVIKTINGESAPEKVQKLREAAQSSGANIRFIDGYIPRRDAINLVASFDSFVSLHRSEGLGIGMAQAMRLGKPVIATGYSGNMDFMNHNNSYLVRYQLTELQEDYGPYEKGNVWAEPDLEHAAALMRQVYEDRVAAQQIANRAALDIKTRMIPEVTGREMKERLLNVV